jgi:RND family efflux transporter MFP subunit
MKRRIVWINAGLALLLVTVGAGAYFWLFAPKTEVATSGRTVTVQKGEVSETVTGTGTVETAGTLELSFSTDGTVNAVKVEQGETVKANQKLATLDDSAAQASVTSAQSSYVQAVNSAKSSSLTLAQAQQAVKDAEASATLNKTGYEQAVSTAKQNLAEAKASWSDSCLDPNGTCPDTDAWAQLRTAEADVANAKTAYEQAVQNATQDETTQDINIKHAATNLQTAQDNYGTACSTYGSGSTQCTSAYNSYISAQQAYESAANSQSASTISSQQSLVNADTKVTAANVALKKLQASLQKQNAQDVQTAQESLDSALLAQKKGLASDKKSVQSAKEQVASLQASDASVSTSAGTISADQAAIEVAKAGLEEAQSNLSATVLRSPVKGTVAAIDVEKGDTVSAGTTVATILPKASYQIVSSFSEADALKLAVGQKATVTFDALSETAEGTVTEVDILPTSSTSGTTSSVTTYNATITIDKAPDDVRQGMSASVVVTTDEASDVLWVPSAAVTTAGGVSTVTVRTNGVDSTVTVETGLEGDSGTEITSGLSEGQQVVIDTSSTESSSTSGFPAGGGLGFAGGGQGGPPAGGGR